MTRSQSLASVLLVPSGQLPRQEYQQLHTRSDTYYDVLGVPRTSSTNAIKSAFRTVRPSAVSP